MTMLRFAIVNAGERATAWARVARRLPGVTIAAVVEPAAEAARRVAEQVGAALWETSVGQLHERHDDSFDAWIAATPAGLLFARQNHQPLDVRFEAWPSNPAGWLWGHAARFSPAVRAVKESLDSGKLGAPGLVRIHHWQAKSAGDVRHAMLPQLDVAGWLIDQPVTLVYAQTRPAAAGERSHEYLQVHLGLADDRMALIDCSTALTTGDDYYSLSVIGSTGAAYADDHHNQQLLFRGDRPQSLRTSQGDGALLNAWQEFLDADAKRRPPSCGAAEWQRAQQLSAAIDRSIASGEAVALAAGAMP